MHLPTRKPHRPRLLPSSRARRTPSQETERVEIVARVRDALDAMSPMDRGVLALCHFEQLSNVEAARVLQVDPKAASKRHSRALRKLSRVLKRLPGMEEPEYD